MKFCERLKKIRIHLELNQSDIASKLSIATSTYQYYERGDRTMPQDVLTRLIAIFTINPSWLLLGSGTMIGVDKDDNNFMNIKYFDEVQASAGAGAFNETELFSSYPMPAGIDINPQHDVIINVIGDSMMPTLNNSDKVLINTALVEKLVIDNIYAVITDGTLFVKRYSGVLNDAHVFSSDNKTYSNIYLKQNDDKNIVVGLVKRIVDRKLQ